MKNHSDSSKFSSATKTERSSLLDYLEHIEEMGVVSETVSPNKPGRIRYQGTWWTAVCTQNIVLSVGSTIRVVGIKMNICIIEPFSAQN
jgi:membrane protein implicated in regulation of membrane protease activity